MPPCGWCCRLRVIHTMSGGPKSGTGTLPLPCTPPRSICNLTALCNIIYEWPHPPALHCGKSATHFRQPCAQTPAISAPPCSGVCANSVPLLPVLLNPPITDEDLQRKASECESGKDTLGSHGIPLRTQLDKSPPHPQNQSTLPLLFFFSTPLCCPHPRFPSNFPNPKHLIEQLRFLTCGLICSLNTWLIQ